MASGGKKKTTMAKLAREHRLRERRVIKQAKKDARKLASSDPAGSTDAAPEPAPARADEPVAIQAAVESAVSAGADVDR